VPPISNVEAKEWAPMTSILTAFNKCRIFRHFGAPKDGTVPHGHSLEMPFTTGRKIFLPRSRLKRKHLSISTPSKPFMGRTVASYSEANLPAE